MLIVYSLLSMEETKSMCIEAIVGNRHKSVTFEVPASFAQYMAELNKRNANGEEVYKVEGGKQTKIRITIFSQRNNF